MTDNVEQKDIEDLRERFLNRDFDEKEFEISAEKTISYARLCGETADRFLDENHPDFHPIFGRESS